MAAPKRSLDIDRVIRRAMTVTSDTERAREVVKRFYDGGARGEIASAGCRAPCTTSYVDTGFAARGPRYSALPFTG